MGGVETSREYDVTALAKAVLNVPINYETGPTPWVATVRTIRTQRVIAGHEAVPRTSDEVLTKFIFSDKPSGVQPFVPITYINTYTIN